MQKLAHRPRQSKLQALLEAYDFDMNALPEAARHQLLVPARLRLYGLSDPGPDAQGIRHGPEVVEGTDYLAWAECSVIEIAPAETRGCFWDFVNCAEARPDQVLDFFRTWGIYEDTSRADHAGNCEVADFVGSARRLRSVLLTLVATEAREPVTEEVLDDLAELTSLDLGNLRDAPEVLRRLGLPEDFDDELPDGVTYPVFWDARRDRWRALRGTEDGVLLQAQVIASLLNEQVAASPGAFVWDLDGRRLERVAVGVRAICWSHLAALFSAPLLDILVCSVCGRTFEFDQRLADRRPRAGVRTLCSDECRKEAKREANRLSWQKNKNKWRPSKGTRKEGNDGQAS